MKLFRSFVVLLCAAVMASVYSAHAQAANAPIRAFTVYSGAWMNAAANPWIRDLLQRAKNSEYNYVMVNFDILYEGEFYPNTAATVFQTAFELADEYGMKVIPVIPVATKGFNSPSWRKILPAISLNVFPGASQGREDLSKIPEDIVVTSSGDNDPRLNAAIAQMLVRMRQEYNQAVFKNLPKTYVEYVNFDFEESYAVDLSYRIVSMLDYGSGYDKVLVDQYLAAGDALSDAYAKVISRGFLNAVRLVKRNLDSRAKVMVFSDMFDSERNGVWHSYLTRRGDFINYVRNTGKDPLDLPGLTTTLAKDSVKNNVVLLSWMYDALFVGADALPHEYNFDKAFDYYVNRGFRFVAYSALDIPKGWDATPNSVLFALEKNIRANQRFPSHGLGYVSSYWPCDREKGTPPGNANRPARCGAGHYGTQCWDPAKPMMEQPLEYDVIELAPKAFSDAGTGMWIRPNTLNFPADILN